MNSEERKEAMGMAGWRERYAMEHGNQTVVYVNGERCLKYTYSKYDEYQDANGAMYNTERKRWVN